MPIPQCHRFFAVVASFAAFVALTFSPLRAFAHDVPRVPAHATSATVRVDAYEHSSLGAVVGDGHLVLVPFTAIEVARPTWPHAIVVDAAGKRHDAGVAATDRASGLAILVVDAVLTTTPFVMSPSKISDVIDVFAISDTSSWGPITDAVWSFYPAGILAAEGRVPVVQGQTYRMPASATDGSPVIDIEGRLVAIMGASTFLIPRALEIAPDALRRLDGTSRGRRRVIFYGGLGTPFAFAPDGGLWFGVSVSFGVRFDDVVELRLDTEFSVLVPMAVETPAERQAPLKNDGSCLEQACYAGLRGVATPSVGHRFVIGGIGGLRAWPIALTPSIGFAVGAQATHRENGATASDAATPSTWGQVAPGLTFSGSMLELRSRVRVPLDGTTSPTIDLAFGMYF